MRKEGVLRSDEESPRLEPLSLLMVPPLVPNMAFPAASTPSLFSWGGHRVRHFDGLTSPAEKTCGNS